MSPAKPSKLSPRQEAASADTAAKRLTELAADPKLARLVATNPSAPVELLLELSHSDDKAVRKACTSNANTPVEALLKLGAQFPEQLLENPVFDLLLLAHPGLFEELPTATLNSLLKRDQVPVGLIRWAWKHRGESTLHSLLMNPNTPADVVEELCKAKDPEVRMAAELHCSRGLPMWANALHNENDICNQKSRLNLKPDASSSSSHDLSILHDLVDNHDGTRLLKLVSKDISRDVKDGISDGRKSLWVDRCGGLNGFKQRHRDLCASIPTVGPDFGLDRLSKHPNRYARCCAALSDKAPPRVLELLSTDADMEVRAAVALNPAATPELLDRLSFDDDRGHPSGFPEYLFYFGVKVAVACNPNTAHITLLRLAQDPNSIVRGTVAEHPSLSEDIWEALARDTSFGVRLRLFRSDQVAAATAMDIRVSLLSEIFHEESKRSKPSPFRRYLFTLLECPPSILAKHFRSRSWLERFAIAGNPSTPDAILERMAQEGNQLVQRAAKANLDARSTKQPGTNSHEGDQA